MDKGKMLQDLAEAAYFVTRSVFHCVRCGKHLELECSSETGAEVAAAQGWIYSDKFLFDNDDEQIHNGILCPDHAHLADPVGMLIKAIKGMLDAMEIQKTNVGRAWLKTPIFAIYVRVTKRLIEGQMVGCLDLASFEIHEEFRRQGLATKFIKAVEEISPYPYLYIENCSYEEWAKSLMRDGWKIQDSGTVIAANCWCLYKRREAKVLSIVG